MKVLKNNFPIAGLKNIQTKTTHDEPKEECINAYKSIKPSLLLNRSRVVAIPLFNLTMLYQLKYQDTK